MTSTNLVKLEQLERNIEKFLSNTIYDLRNSDIVAANPRIKSALENVHTQLTATRIVLFHFKTKLNK